VWLDLRSPATVFGTQRRPTGPRFFLFFFVFVFSARLARITADGHPNHSIHSQLQGCSSKKKKEKKKNLSPPSCEIPDIAPRHDTSPTPMYLPTYTPRWSPDGKNGQNVRCHSLDRLNNASIYDQTKKNTPGGPSPTRAAVVAVSLCALGRAGGWCVCVVGGCGGRVQNAWYGPRSVRRSCRRGRHA